MGTQTEGAENFVAMDILEGEQWQPSHGEICIYRVPDRVRRVNPEAFNPDMLLIGPLQYSRRKEAHDMLKCEGSNVRPGMEDRYIQYADMEMRKRIYLTMLEGRVGSQLVRDFDRYLRNNEDHIRKCYAESTTWINSSEFNEMILLDSVFIAELFVRCYDEKENGRTHDHDVVVNKHFLRHTISQDLILLENQLPYFILEKLFDLILPGGVIQGKELTTSFFNICRIDNDKHFKHFTDLFRLIRIKYSKKRFLGKKETIQKLHSVEKLKNSGVAFVLVDEVDDDDPSIQVRCGAGNRLEMTAFRVCEDTERILRNVMALEECHYPEESYVSSYVIFLNFLIETDRDVEILEDNKIIKNFLGRRGSVAELVKKLSIGFIENESYYSHVAYKLNIAYNTSYLPHVKSRGSVSYDSCWNFTWSTLKSTYFKDVWTGTASVAGTLVLALSIAQTLLAVLQLQKT